MEQYQGIKRSIIKLIAQVDKTRVKIQIFGPDPQVRTLIIIFLPKFDQKRVSML